MANALTSIQRTAYSAFHEALAQGTGNFLKCGGVYAGSEKNLTLTMSQAAGGFTAYTAPGTSVTKDILSGLVTFSATPKAKIERLTFSQVNDNPELVAQRSAAMANQALQAINASYFAGLSALSATTHPLVGSSAGNVGTSKKYADTAMGVGAVSQSNLFTSALSRSAVVGAIETLGNWVSWGSGDALNLGSDMEKLVLVVDHANRDLAESIAGSAVISADMQKNGLLGRITVVANSLADSDDWMLIDTAAGLNGQGPTGMWIRQMPQIRVTQDSSQGGLDWVIAASYEADFVYDVEGAGIVVSNVA